MANRKTVGVSFGKVGRGEELFRWLLVDFRLSGDKEWYFEIYLGRQNGCRILLCRVG